jgi:hypothetical protein
MRHIANSILTLNPQYITGTPLLFFLATLLSILCLTCTCRTAEYISELSVAADTHQPKPFSTGSWHWPSPL